MPSPVRQFLERVIPWFDPAREQRSQALTEAVVERAEQVLQEGDAPSRDRVRPGYLDYADRLGRRQ